MNNNHHFLGIDVHHHSYPPAYVSYLEEANHSPGGWVTEPWNLGIACDFCREKDIKAAILSCIPGGPHSDMNLERALEFTRSCNVWNAEMVQKSPHALGFFAHITNLCEIDLTLQEIKYALEDLGADGIALATSYHKNGQLRYLGDPLFVPVWDLLSARKTVVFIHPAPSSNIAMINRNLPPPAFEFPHETGRTAIDMIINSSNMLRDHAINCKIILSHAGGDLPYLIDRVAGLMCLGPPTLRIKKTPQEVLTEARCFYYDTALSSSPMHLSALTTLLGSDHVDHILLGTDFPPAGVDAIEYFLGQLRESKSISLEKLHKNALKAFPRLEQRQG